MRNALCVALVVAGVVLAGRIGDARVNGSHVAGSGSVTCSKDEIVLWSGETNSHSMCWPLSDAWMLVEVR